ncbi:hypothetical protein ACVTTK_02665 [Alcaligenes nematophilus]
MKRIGFMTRLSPENHQWLEARAKQEDRSMTYVVDQLIADARKGDAEKENAPEAATSEALVSVTP